MRSKTLRGGLLSREKNREKLNENSLFNLCSVLVCENGHWQVCVSLRATTPEVHCMQCSWS